MSEAQHRNPEELLEQLSQAIADEAEALASANAGALMDAVERKEQAAQALEGLEEDATVHLDPVRLAELREANLSNAALMQVAQGHVIWALNQLGRMEAQTTYTQGGHKAMHTRPHYFGAA